MPEASAAAEGAASQNRGMLEAACARACAVVRVWGCVGLGVAWPTLKGGLEGNNEEAQEPQLFVV